MSAHTLHHVTAVTAQIRENRRFYTEVLGLRLVKRSVNQDEVSAYHLFYADAVGTPGTDLTFFDWPTMQPNQPGAGTASLVSFGVPAASLEFWEGRLDAAGCYPDRAVDEQDRESILFSDPEGQRLELISLEGLELPGTPWTERIAEEDAIRGLFGVDLESARPDATWQVLTEFLGYGSSQEFPGFMEAGGDRTHTRVRLIENRSNRMGRVGAGGVHHVAFRVADEAELLAKQEQLESRGIQTSGEIDRFYFKSLYFREPGGILFELATDGPGFASDEPLESLGEHLALPPFLEDRRAEIEAGLKPL
jgi:glyoxalase family protein